MGACVPGATAVTVGQQNALANTMKAWLAMSPVFRV